MEESRRREKAVELATEIVALAEEEDALLTTLLRKMRRLALLTDRTEILLWTDWQQQGWQRVAGPRYRASNEESDWAEVRFWRTRRVYELGPEKQEPASWGDQRLLSHSVGELQQLLGVPPNVSAETVAMASQIPRILGWVRDEIHAIASEVLVWMSFGDVVQGIFDHARQLVDTRLVHLAPEAAKELAAAYAQLGSAAEPEELAGAANACRRILKDLADALYPPREGEVAYDMEIGSNQYVNRLRAYAHDHIHSRRTRATWEAGIEHLDKRLATVNRLASKGAHEDLTIVEARMCLIYTYLVVADLLELAEPAEP